MSPALAGGFLTTVPPGKPTLSFYNHLLCLLLLFFGLVYFVRYKCNFSHFVLVSSCMEYNFLSFHFDSMFVLKSEMGLSYSWVSFFKIHSATL